MKKYLAILLSVVLMLSLAIPAFAADEKGSITITNPTKGQTYSAYKILDLVSYDEAAGAYRYVFDSDWADIVDHALWNNGQSFKWIDDNGKEQTMNASDYLGTDGSGYVTWNNDGSVFSKDEAARGFAQLAKAYAVKKGIDPDVPPITPDKDHPEVKFENLDLGYYLIDTTLGSLCSLDTTDPDVEMTEKNVIPTIQKQVYDSTNYWHTLDDSAIGDTVTFRSFFTIDANAEGTYTVHDVMEKGLTFDHTSVKVYAIDDGKVNNLPTDEEMASLANNLLTRDYQLIYDQDENDNTDDPCTFHVEFDDDYVAAQTKDTLIVIEYKATLNEKAKIYEELNNNKTWLQYGNSNTAESEANVQTVKVHIVKTDESAKLLEGAQFKLYDKDNTEIALVKEAEGIYHIATPAEKAVAGFEADVVEGSSIVIKGLEMDVTYYLKETEAPAGYNKLTDSVEICVNMDNLNRCEAKIVDGTYVSGGYQVENRTGTELPETGGMGTTIFYIVGGIMVAAAVVLLVTKKRMSVEG